MLPSFISLFFITNVYSEPLASFSGPAHISLNLTNQTHNNKFSFHNKFDLSFKSALSYGFILAAFDSSHNVPFR